MSFIELKSVRAWTKACRDGVVYSIVKQSDGKFRWQRCKGVSVVKSGSSDSWNDAAKQCYLDHVERGAANDDERSLLMFSQITKE